MSRKRRRCSADFKAINEIASEYEIKLLVGLSFKV